MAETNNIAYKTKVPFGILGEIFGRIWALWMLIAFVSTMLAFVIFYIPCLFLKGRAYGKWHIIVSKTWTILFSYLVGCPVIVKGKENVQKGTNYIIVCNHNSLVDVPLNTGVYPNINKTIAKSDFASVPIFGWVYRSGSVLVDRKNPNSRKESYNAMKKVLADGYDMIVFPEGTRNKTNDPLIPFLDGAFLLATETKHPVLPMLTFNTRKILPLDKTFFAWPHIVKVRFLPPVDSSNIKTRDLKAKVFKIMWDEYEKNSPKTEV